MCGDTRINREVKNAVHHVNRFPGSQVGPAGRRGYRVKDGGAPGGIVSPSPEVAGQGFRTLAQDGKKPAGVRACGCARAGHAKGSTCGPAHSGALFEAGSVEVAELAVKQRKQGVGGLLPDALEEVVPGKPPDGPAENPIVRGSQETTEMVERSEQDRMTEEFQERVFADFSQIDPRALMRIPGLDVLRFAAERRVAKSKKPAPERGSGFDGTKAEHRNVAFRMAPIPVSDVGLRTVFDDKQAVLPGEIENELQVHPAAEEMGDKDGPAVRREDAGEVAGIDREGAPADIERNGHQAVVFNNPDHVGNGDRRANDFGPCGKGEGSEQQVEAAAHRETGERPPAGSPETFEAVPTGRRIVWTETTPDPETQVQPGNIQLFSGDHW